MSDKPIADMFGSAECDAALARLRQTALRRRLRAALIAIAAGAIALCAGVDSYAQSIVPTYEASSIALPLSIHHQRGGAGAGG